MNATKSETPVLDLIRAAEAAGWTYQAPRGPGHDRNPNALTLGCTTYSTLVATGVQVALGNLLLYYHNGRPWRADVQPEGRVVIEAIVVKPEFRRHGIASKAIKGLQELAAGLDLELWLEATPIEAFKAKGQRTITTRRLVNWYKSLGFVEAYPGEGNTILKWRAEK